MTEPQPQIGTALVIRSGDRVLIGFAETYTGPQMAAVRNQLREHFPGVEFALVGPVTGMAVYRPDATEETPGDT